MTAAVGVTIGVDDPRVDDIRALLSVHLTHAYTHSPADDVHALDLDGLLDPAVTFFSARRDGVLLAIGALKELGAGHGEVKSMHTAEAARRQGLGAAMAEHILRVARGRGYGRLSLETGSGVAYDGARRLYARCGFVPCGPFGDYRPSPNSAFMTIELAAPGS